MEIILLERIRNLGGLGDKVKVKAGFGRNYLIPQGKAVSATANNLKKFEARRAELEKAAAITLKAAEQRAEQLRKLGVITITARAAEEGKLYGSVTTHEIAAAITAAGVEIEKREVLMPLGPIRQIGEYDLDIQIHGDIIQTIKVAVVAE